MSNILEKANQCPTWVVISRPSSERWLLPTAQVIAPKSPIPEKSRKRLQLNSPEWFKILGWVDTLRDDRFWQNTCIVDEKTQRLRPCCYSLCKPGKQDSLSWEQIWQQYWQRLYKSPKKSWRDCKRLLWIEKIWEQYCQRLNWKKTYLRTEARLRRSSSSISTLGLPNI